MVYSEPDFHFDLELYGIVIPLAIRVVGSVGENPTGWTEVP